jgi:hypothetical protein
MYENRKAVAELIEANRMMHAAAKKLEGVNALDLPDVDCERLRHRAVLVAADAFQLAHELNAGRVYSEAEPAPAMEGGEA